MKFQRVVALPAPQPAAALRIGQLLLQLQQQRGAADFPAGIVLPSGGRRGRGRGPCGGGGQKEEVGLPGFAELGLAAALQQLLKLGPQPPEARFQAGGLQQPVATERIVEGQAIAEALAPVGAALPEVGAGGEQEELHRRKTTDGLEQPHLHRRQAAEAK